ncbi:MAG TPA: HIT family protein [Burkholderiales bacterium]|nr:HIT family protein [Burkholderiales bacterium]
MSAPAAACIFCQPEREIIAANARALAVFDKFPVSPGHALVLPRRHVASLWELDPEEYAQCFALVRELHPFLEARFRPDGYNVGVNQGQAAGQSVWHAHIHVIPRFAGDNPDPLGGVRNVIPRKGRY